MRDPGVTEAEVKAGVTGAARGRHNLHDAPRQTDQHPGPNDPGLEPQVVVAPTAPYPIGVALGLPARAEAELEPARLELDCYLDGAGHVCLFVDDDLT